MQLNKLIVHNIRSYTHQELSFPKGTVLLSGDIGAGKSSLLLAIEFAIFGVMRGQLEGHALLRHGENEGYVELHCNLQDHSIIITRKLKRTKRGIQQDSGSLVIDGIKEDLTAQEIKSRMLELMGYPKDLLTKSKSLIFRYTVYTPQEQMKAILFEDANERLNTLRRVFDIDKYKRIKENAQTYARLLREKKKKFEGQLVGYDKKVQQYDLLKSQRKEAEEKVQKLKPQQTAIAQELQKYSDQLRKLDEQSKVLFEAKKQVQVLETRIKYEMQRKMELENEIKRLKNQYQAMKEEFSIEEIPDHTIITNSIADTEKRLIQLRKEKELAGREISAAGVRIAHATEIKQNLQKLSACPTCLQEVTEDHKNHVFTRENSRIKEHVQSQTVLQQKTTELLTKEKQLVEDLTHLRRKEKDAAVFTIKQKAIKEKEEHITTQQDKIPNLLNQIKEHQTNKQELNAKLFPLENVEHELKEARALVEKTQTQERDLSIKLTAADKELQNVSNLMKNLAQEIAEKESAKKQLEKLNALSHWLTDYFVKLMDTIEKHVMLSVYHQFNGLFQKWFNTLIEDETMNARLDDSFTPLIEQNGYETTLDNLSGGEKTSCALAYRLALNKVINDLISTIHTKDLIILDEPTDGFSMEQLDKVREVLDELEIAQVLIVSHESKIESFVDSAIKIDKHYHESSASAI